MKPVEIIPAHEQLPRFSRVLTLYPSTHTPRRLASHLLHPELTFMSHSISYQCVRGLAQRRHETVEIGPPHEHRFVL